jgi:hypothetical protein
MGKINARSTYFKSRILNWFHPHQGNVTVAATLGTLACAAHWRALAFTPVKVHGY